jgi:hypothetical protein
MPVGKSAHTHPAVIALDQDVTLNLTDAEVKQLWAFQDGSIMSVDARHHLWQSWGFCPRHTWAAAVTESTLRWNLHGTAILYKDLTGRAVATLRRPAVRNSTVAHRLQAHASCFTCDFLRIAKERSAPRLVAARERVNKRERFTELLMDAEPVWSGRTCPYCLGGGGLVCRPHILAGAQVPGGLPEGLADVRVRLEAFWDSMRWHGPTANADERSSWVEALGWFAGWHYPAAAARAGRPAIAAGFTGANTRRE